MIRGNVVIDQNRCKGCALCVAFCPQDVLTLAGDRLNAKGYHPAELLTALPDAACTGCGICAVVCPDVCITVYRAAPAAKHAR